MRFQLSGVANLVSLPKEFTMENTEILNYISLRDKNLSIFPKWYNYYLRVQNYINETYVL